MLIQELMALHEGFSKDTKEWVKDEFGDKAEVKGNKVLIKMSQEEYDKGLLKLLTKFDFHCPENMKHVGKDWGATFKDGVATVTLG